MSEIPSVLLKKKQVYGGGSISVGLHLNLHAYILMYLTVKLQSNRKAVKHFNYTSLRNK